MRKIKLLLTTVLIATLVLSGVPANMIQKETDVKAESDNVNGKEGEFYYEILNDGTIKITGFNRTYLPDISYPDSLNIPRKIAGRDVTCIGYGVFQNCRDVTTIDIPDSVTTIESYAFAGTWAHINITSGVKNIGSWAFSGCGSVSISGIIGNTWEFTIPQGVTRIEEGVFSNCTWMETVVIPSGVTSIGNQAFDGCSTLKSVTIPNTVKSIGEKAFNNCTELTYIKIPTNTTIGADAFASCDKLKIEYETEVPTTKVDTTKPVITTPTTTNEIVKPIKPNKVTIKKVNSKKKSAKKVKLTLKKIDGVVGYQVAVYKTKNNAKKNKNAIVKKIVKNTKAAIKSKKLKNAKKLYIRARAYIMNGKTKLYGEWSKIKKVKIKK